MISILRLYIIILIVLSLSSCGGGDSASQNTDSTDTTAPLTSVSATVNTSNLPAAVSAKAASVISLSDSIDFQEAVSGLSITHKQGLPTIIVSDSGKMLMMTTESNNGVLDFSAQSTAIALVSILLEPADYGATEEELRTAILDSVSLTMLTDELQVAFDNGISFEGNQNIEDDLAALISEVIAKLASNIVPSGVKAALAPFDNSDNIATKGMLPFELISTTFGSLLLTDGSSAKSIPSSTSLYVQNRAPVYFSVNNKFDTGDYSVKPAAPIVAYYPEVEVPHNKKSVALQISYDGLKTYAYIGTEIIGAILPCNDTCKNAILKVLIEDISKVDPVVISRAVLLGSIYDSISSQGVIELIAPYLGIDVIAVEYMKKLAKWATLFSGVYTGYEIGESVATAIQLSGHEGREVGVCISDTGDIMNCATSLSFAPSEFAIWPNAIVDIPPVIAKDKGGVDTLIPGGLRFDVASLSGTKVDEGKIVAAGADINYVELIAFDQVTGIIASAKFWVTEPDFDRETIEVNVGEVAEVNIVDPNGRTILYGKSGTDDGVVNYVFELSADDYKIANTNYLIQFSPADTEPDSVLIKGLSAGPTVVTATSRETGNVIDIDVNVIPEPETLVLGCPDPYRFTAVNGLQTIGGTTIYCVYDSNEPLEKRRTNIPISFSGNIIGDLRFGDWLGWASLTSYYPGPYVTITITAGNDVIVGGGASAAYDVMDKKGAWTGLGAPGSTLNINAGRNVKFTSSTRISNCGNTEVCNAYSALPVTVNIRAGGDVTVNIERDLFWDASNTRATNINVCAPGKVTIDNVSIGVNSINGAGCN